MGSVFSSKISKEELEMALNKAKEIVSSNPVVVFRFLCFLLCLSPSKYAHSILLDTYILHYLIKFVLLAILNLCFFWNWMMGIFKLFIYLFLMFRTRISM